MGKIVLAAVAATAVILFVLPYVLRPDLGVYEQLRAPKVREMADQQMLVVELQGEPAEVIPRALSLLLNAYYRIPSVPQGSQPPALRVRRSDERTGVYGLPVPPGTAQLSAREAGKGPGVRLEVWQYGEVAEILHAGPYRDEGPVIEKLEAFIRQQGYRIEGGREEEFLRGPGVLSRGNSRNYYTILRYRVSKQAPLAPQPAPGTRS
ncbi:MAG: hypothetical protein ACYC5N_00645 [Endomicrobiales bacterium]